ncbi:MAG: hypothetical protein PWQ70_1880 [Clostridiales bacterium]|jgi:UDP-perosamine 4-acetyltransferase|nr:hypothetical protein [Clostridiales bacterium]
MNKLILLGAGGHCKVVIDVIKTFYDIVGITDIDRSKHGQEFYGIAVLGNDDILHEMFAKGVRKALVTLGSIGNSSIRKKLFEYAKDIGYDMINAVSNDTVISKSVRMGVGNIVMDGVIIHADAVIGNNTILNTSCIIEHDCMIEDHVHISPGAKLAGAVRIGEGTHIGLGANIIQNISIGKNCIIGAGAVVTKDIPDNCTAVGVPARVIKML